ncbi:MAG: hypothetical protein CVU39_07635 [Chloroflexi bacterium HGW-Chloroflexi-10]|nr:MAG: hypothetical protein CVU39_07635 [Chloroflexi bacterium HGW-Chloroflexi-10]
MLTIFVIGNPAVGKTTLANITINQIPNIRVMRSIYNLDTFHFVEYQQSAYSGFFLSNFHFK